MSPKQQPTLLDQQHDAMRRKGYVTPEEASRLSKTPKQTVYTWVREGAVDVQRVGRRRVYVSLESLRKLVGILMPAA